MQLDDVYLLADFRHFNQALLVLLLSSGGGAVGGDWVNMCFSGGLFGLILALPLVQTLGRKLLQLDFLN